MHFIEMYTFWGQGEENFFPSEHFLALDIMAAQILTRMLEDLCHSSILYQYVLITLHVLNPLLKVCPDQALVAEAILLRLGKRSERLWPLGILHKLPQAGYV